jgi:isochorismate hydrolase
MTSPDAPPRSPELLDRHRSRLLIVDVQQKLVPHIHGADPMIAHCRKLIQGAAVLGVPAFATEQYRKGLGETVPELAELLPDRPDKLRFSGVEALGWQTAAEAADERDQIVVAGIETHVCVLQTAFDLMSIGYQVFIPADAVASRKTRDWEFALKRLADAGATVVTTESVLFEWAEAAGTPEFKEISRLVKDSAV